MPAPQPPLTRLADGTVKQVSPITGTQVWTVPGRGHRPLGGASAQPGPLDPAAEGRHCALCHHRYLETPPEKARLVRSPDGWVSAYDVPAERLFDDVAEFRRIPNLFEIVSFDYWHANHGFVLPPARSRRMAAYLATPAGRAHVLAVSRARLGAAGIDDAAWAALSETERLAPAPAFFGGGHELVVARRHFRDDAAHDDELASSGTLTPAEHAQYTAFTIAAMREIYRDNPHVRYVVVFQNWLKPAGASFDHLHKQLVAIDEHGVRADVEIERLEAEPDLFNRAVLAYAVDQGLVVAANEHAVAFAGFGHRYPTLEIYSAAAANAPWEHDDAALRGVSDVLHACHAATGAGVPSNEEWYHRPPDTTARMPWRIMLKWRISTPAGFEGGTKIYLNTIDPWTLRDRVVARLHELRDAGLVAPLAVGAECRVDRDALRYAAGS